VCHALIRAVDRDRFSLVEEAVAGRAVADSAAEHFSLSFHALCGRSAGRKQKRAGLVHFVIREHHELIAHVGDVSHTRVFRLKLHFLCLSSECRVEVRAGYHRYARVVRYFLGFAYLVGKLGRAEPYDFFIMQLQSQSRGQSRRACSYYRNVIDHVSPFHKKPPAPAAALRPYLFSSICLRSQLIQASNPSPVFADTKNISESGLRS